MKKNQHKQWIGLRHTATELWFANRPVPIFENNVDTGKLARPAIYDTPMLHAFNTMLETTIAKEAFYSWPLAVSASSWTYIQIEKGVHGAGN